MSGFASTSRFFASLVFAVVVLLTISHAEAQFAGGTGGPNNPYQIAMAEHLIAIGADPNLLDKHFVLTADIDLDPNLPGGRVFTQAVIAPAVGNPQNPERLFFTGTFDGKDHTIRNLTIHGKGDARTTGRRPAAVPARSKGSTPPGPNLHAGSIRLILCLSILRYPTGRFHAPRCSSLFYRPRPLRIPNKNRTTPPPAASFSASPAG